MSIEKPLVLPMTPLAEAPFYPRIPDLSIELSNYCNMHCPYCANRVLTRPRGGISWELLEKIVVEAGKYQLNIRYLHGTGEPLLYNRLEDVIRLIRHHNAGEGSFATNGSLMTLERAKSLLDAGLTSIYFSVDTLDPDLYKKTRGSNLAAVVANIQKFIHFVPESFPITIALMNHKKQYLQKHDEKKFHELFGSSANVVMNVVDNAFFPSATEDYRINTDRGPTCTAPLNYLFIDYRGHAAICCLDQDVLHLLGDVGQRSIVDVWYNQQNQTYFRNLALGILEVPETCLKKCVLLETNKNVTHALAGLLLPYEETFLFAKLLYINREYSESQRLLSCLIKRDGKNTEVNNLLHMTQAELSK